MPLSAQPQNILDPRRRMLLTGGPLSGAVQGALPPNMPTQVHQQQLVQALRPSSAGTLTGGTRANDTGLLPFGPKATTMMGQPLTPATPTVGGAAPVRSQLLADWVAAHPIPVAPVQRHLAQAMFGPLGPRRFGRRDDFRSDRGDRRGPTGRGGGYGGSYGVGDRTSKGPGGTLGHI